MNKKKNSRVGMNMKPRVTKEVSAATAQQVDEISPVLEQQEPVETSGNLADKSVQILDSGEKEEKTASVAAETPSDDPLEELMRKSSEPGTYGETGLGENVETGCISNEELKRRESAEEAIPTINPVSISELEDAMSKNRHIEILPNGTTTIGPEVGQRSDGTFGLVVTIPEGLIDPIQQQAESDGATPEDWVSTRLTEYLESWWSAPRGR